MGPIRTQETSSESCLSFVSPLSLKLFGHIVIAALKVLELSLQVLILGHEGVYISVAWSTHGLLDIIVHIPWLFWLLVESNKHLG